MKRVSLEEIIERLGCDYTLRGCSEKRYISNVQPIEVAGKDSLVWLKPSRSDKQSIIQKTKAEILICDDSLRIPENLLIKKCFIIVKNPKLAFLRVVRSLFFGATKYGIHSTSCIHPDAKIHPKTFIGPFTYIGKCTVGENSVIYGHCYLYDKVAIGKNVIIHAGAVIGADGYGYSRNEECFLEKFPHVGGVVIEDDVEIGSNSCIDRGTLGNTLIKKGAKIDNLVHIAHNVVVGRHAAVIAHAIIGGSTKIGDYAWIAPAVSLMNGIVIGQKATVGLGAVVTKNIPAGQTWLGSPAIPIEDFKRLQKKIRKLQNQSS